MEIFLLDVSNSHFSIGRLLLINPTFTPDNALSSSNCISDVNASLIEYNYTNGTVDYLFPLPEKQ